MAIDHQNWTRKIHDTEPDMYIEFESWGGISVSRSEGDAYVTVKLEGFKIHSTGKFGQPYSAPNHPYDKKGIAFNIDAQNVGSNGNFEGPNSCSAYPWSSENNFYGFAPKKEGGYTGIYTITWTIRWTEGNLRLFTLCEFGYPGSEYGCNVGGNGRVFAEYNISECPYITYSSPSIQITNTNVWGQKIYKLGDTINVSWKTTKGSHNIEYDEVKAYNRNTNYPSDNWWNSFTWTSEPIYSDNFAGSHSKSISLSSDKFSEINSYAVQASVMDSKGGTHVGFQHDPYNINNPGDRMFYIGRRPTISSISPYSTTQNANTSKTFTCSGTNLKYWPNESAFRSYYKWNNGSWNDYGTSTSLTFYANDLRSIIPKSQDGVQQTLAVKRYSPTTDWYSASTVYAYITLYYRPRVRSNRSYL